MTAIGLGLGLVFEQGTGTPTPVPPSADLFQDTGRRAVWMDAAPQGAALNAQVGSCQSATFWGPLVGSPIYILGREMTANTWIGYEVTTRGATDDRFISHSAQSIYKPARFVRWDAGITVADNGAGGASVYPQDTATTAVQRFRLGTLDSQVTDVALAVCFLQSNGVNKLVVVTISGAVNGAQVANRLHTAAQAVADGWLASGALVSNGGSIADTARVMQSNLAGRARLDNRSIQSVPIARNLPPDDYTITATVTTVATNGEANAASRAYVAGCFFSSAAINEATSGALMARMDYVSAGNDASTDETFFLNGRVTGVGSNRQIGKAHGNEIRTAEPTLLVDGAAYIPAGNSASRARTSNVATIVTQNPHGLTTGDVVTISGFGSSTYSANEVSVTVANGTTFTYANTGTNEGTTADTAGRFIRKGIKLGSSIALSQPSQLFHNDFGSGTTPIGTLTTRYSFNGKTLVTDALPTLTQLFTHSISLPVLATVWSGDPTTKGPVYPGAVTVEAFSPAQSAALLNADNDSARLSGQSKQFLFTRSSTLANSISIGSLAGITSFPSWATYIQDRTGGTVEKMYLSAPSAGTYETAIGWSAALQSARIDGLMDQPPPASAYHPTALEYGTVSGGSGSGGAPKVGDVLSVTGDTWANTGGVTYTYQWYRGLDAIGGATAATYTVVTADQGWNLRRMCTGTNVKGSWTAYTPLTAFVQSTVAATHNITFGTKTRSGFGGYPVGVGRTIAGGTGMADWTINSVGEIVPSGTYAAFMTFTQSSYLLTLDNAQTVAIAMVANRSDVAANAANDAATLPQLSRVTNYITGTGEIVLGDSVFCRDSFVNPTSQRSGNLWYIEFRTTYTGTGRIRIYNLHHGAMNYYAYANQDYPVDFCGGQFVDGSSSTGYATLAFNGNLGWGFKFYDMEFYGGTSKPDPDFIDAWRAKGADGVERCTFHGIGTAIYPNHVAGVTSGDICDNIGYDMAADMINGTWHGAGQKISRNFAYNLKLTPGSHGDMTQHIGFTDGLTHTLGEYAFNAVLRNVGSVNESDFQGQYLGFNLGGSRMQNPNTHHLMALITMPMGISYDYMDNPTIQFCATLFDPNTNSGVPVTGTNMYQLAAAAGTGGLFAKNVSNNNIALAGDVGFGSQSGATFGTHTNIQPPSVANYQAAFAAYPSSPITTCTTRAGMMAIFTAKLNGTLKRVDNTYDGPLLPNGCWNTGEVYP